MSRWRPGEESLKAHRFPDQRLLHEINVPDKAREQRPEREKDYRTIRTQRGATGCRIGDDRIPQTHQHARDDAYDDAFARHGTPRAGQASVSLASAGRS